MTMLYKMNSAGNIRVYEIFAWEDGYRVLWGIKGGELQDKYNVVLVNSSGRPHGMQVQSEIDSKIQTQLDKGYKYTIEEAKAGDTNQIGLKRPMLARPYEEYHIRGDDKIWVQYKYDGHRCMIHNNNGRLIAYSRNGKDILTIDHIKREMNIPVGCTLDGELYIHGMSLQKITSLVKKRQAGNSLLKYYIYDTIMDATFTTRLSALNAMDENDRFGSSAELVPTWQFREEKEQRLHNQIAEAIHDGYEGLIIRRDGEGYMDGKRSKHLLKFKKMLDKEFTIVDIDESKDGWAILVFDEGFSATAPGTHEEKIEMFENADDYIGMKARVEYARLTDDGIPFHPVVTNIVD